MLHRKKKNNSVSDRISKFAIRALKEDTCINIDTKGVDKGPNSFMAICAENF
jgi:hypothetical protein